MRRDLQPLRLGDELAALPPRPQPARHRVNILRALIRDNRTYQATPPQHTSTQAA